MTAPSFPVSDPSWDGVAQAANPVYDPGYKDTFIPTIWSGKLIN